MIKNQFEIDRKFEGKIFDGIEFYEDDRVVITFNDGSFIEIELDSVNESCHCHPHYRYFLSISAQDENENS